MNLQLELRNQQQQQQDEKMETSSTLYAPGLGQQLQPTYVPGQVNYMGHNMHHILHHHRSLTNSPTSNPGSPGLDMIQEELPHVQSSAKSDNQPLAHPQISVTDVLGKSYLS